MACDNLECKGAAGHDDGDCALRLKYRFLGATRCGVTARVCLRRFIAKNERERRRRRIRGSERERDPIRRGGKELRETTKPRLVWRELCFPAI